MTTTRADLEALADAVAVEREACAKIADLMGEVGLEMAGDTILTDPLLSGGEWTDLNCRTSRDCTIDGAIYSSRYHASKDIAAAIRARAQEQS